jgi:hypothetical protein
MKNADAVEADMGLQSAGAIKFCFRRPVRADVRALKRVNRGCSYKKDLLVSNDPALHLPENEGQE